MKLAMQLLNPGSANRGHFHRLLLLGLLLAWLPAQSLFAAQIDLQVLPDRLSINESFRLVYTATGSVDEEPDFSGLTTDFEIISNQSSSSISMINGDISRTKTWTLDLMARRQGNLVIPPIPFGRDYSPARAVTVGEPARANSRDAATTADIFIEVEAEPRSPYVQQQVLLKVKLYHAINLNSAVLSEPTAAEGGDLVIEKLGEDRTYPANHAGRRYRVVERNYALLPQSSGPITITPLQFEGDVGGGSRFGFGSFGGGRRLRVDSDPVKLEVRPVPENFHGNQWLPARNLVLSAEWSDPNPEFRVGEPVTRIIRLSAEGLAASQLPEIELPLPDGIRSYRDQPQLQARADHAGIVAEREEKIALIPQQSGILRLPAIEIPWWNTDSEQLETAHLPAVEIPVLPATGNSTNRESNKAPADTPPLTPAVTTPATNPGSNGPTSQTIEPSFASPGDARLPWAIAGLFALGWAITGWLWRRDRQRGGPKDEEMGRRQVNQALKLACRANDKQLAAKRLLEWGRLRHPDLPPPSLESLALKETGELADQISHLARALYGESANLWNGEQLWKAIKTAGDPKQSSARGKPSTLAPLNPS